jgi:enediyne polyketide synthase
LWTSTDEGLESLIARQVFPTSLQDSNLVGNLYFGNYSAWQGRLRDQFLHDIAPSCFNPEKIGGQLECLSFSTHHLREAMPFDNIEASMYLKALYPGALDLWFEYHRVGTNGTREKLAVGEHRVALVSASGDPLRMISWPSNALGGLKRIVARKQAPEDTRETA